MGEWNLSIRRWSPSRFLISLHGGDVEGWYIQRRNGEFEAGRVHGAGWSVSRLGNAFGRGGTGLRIASVVSTESGAAFRSSAVFGDGTTRIDHFDRPWRGLPSGGVSWNLPSGVSYRADLTSSGRRLSRTTPSGQTRHVSDTGILVGAGASGAWGIAVHVDHPGRHPFTVDFANGRLVGQGMWRHWPGRPDLSGSTGRLHSPARMLRPPTSRSTASTRRGIARMSTSRRPADARHDRSALRRKTVARP